MSWQIQKFTFNYLISVSNLYRSRLKIIVAHFHSYTWVRDCGILELYFYCHVNCMFIIFIYWNPIIWFVLHFLFKSTKLSQNFKSTMSTKLSFSLFCDYWLRMLLYWFIVSIWTRTNSSLFRLLLLTEATKGMICKGFKIKLRKFEKFNFEPFTYHPLSGLS